MRYCDDIPSGEAVMALIQEATELFTQSEDHSFMQNFSFQAELTATGERGRPRFVILRDQLTLLLDLGFKSGEIASLLGVMHQSIPVVPIPPPRATAGHLLTLSVPGAGH